MSEDPLAVSTPRAQPDAEYDSIYAVLVETTRGRRFLTEHARRSRPADIESSLAAITRIEAVLRVESAAQSLDRFRFDVLDIAQAIARAKTEIAAVKSDSTAERALEIHALLNDLDRRINTVIDAWGEPPAEPAPIASFQEPAPNDVAVGQPTAALADERQDATLEDISRVMMALEPLFGGHFADAPTPEESTAEEPITAAGESDALFTAMPRIDEIAHAAPTATMETSHCIGVTRSSVTETEFDDFLFGPEPQAGTQEVSLSASIITPAPLPDDPLAALRALSEAEKIALFS